MNDIDRDTTVILRDRVVTVKFLRRRHFVMKIYVGNLPYSIRDAELEELCLT